MAKRYFNWKLALVLLIGFVVLAGAALALRRWQRATRTDRALPLGLKAFEEQQWDDAATHLGRYLVVKSNDVPILLKYAEAQLKRGSPSPGSFQQALESYRAVLRLDPNNAQAAERLSEMYLAARAPSETELIARRYLEKNKNPVVRRTLALALLAQRRFQDAQSELTGIIKDDPQQVLIYELLGQTAAERPQDSPNLPVFWLDQAVTNNPSSALAYVIRASYFLRTGDLPKALADFEHAEKLDLSDKTVRLRLALELVRANAPDKAREHLKAVQQTAPADPMLWQVWAQLAIRSGSTEEMTLVADSSLKQLGSQSTDLMLVAAELFMFAGHLDRAADLISEIRKRDIFTERAAFLEGMVSDRKGDVRKAIDSWNRAIELARQRQRPREGAGGYGVPDPRIRLALASAFARLGDTQSALWQLRTLVSESPTSFDARMALARLLAFTRNWSEVSEQVRLAAEIAPQNLEAAILRAQARIQLLASGQNPETAPQAWPDLEKYLANLEKASKGALEVRLLQVQAAMLQGKLEQADALAAKLNSEHPAETRAAMAQVEVLIAQSKDDQAVSRLGELLQRFPESPDPARVLALLLNRRNEHDKCESVLTQALTRMKQPSDKRDLGLLLADLYANWNLPEKEYALLSTLSVELPNDLQIKSRLLGCSKMIKDPQSSQKLVDEIKALQGDTGRQWRYEQARVWFRLSTENFKTYYTQAVSLLQANLLANPDDQHSRLLLAATYERAGDLQLAVSTYREALDRSPDNVMIIIATVAALYKTRQDAQAEELLSRAAQQKLYHPELQRLQLQTYLRRGQIGPATDVLQDFVSKDANNVSAGLSLAQLLMRQAKFAEAQTLLDKFKALQPDSMSVAVAQIQLYVRQEKDAEAVRLCDEIIKSQPTVFAYVLRARTYASLGREDKALEDFAHAISVEPNDPNAWVARSTFLRSREQLEQAADDIRRALALAPRNLTVQKLAISTLLASGNPARVQQARTILDEALRTAPDDVELQLFRARFLLSESTAPAIESAQGILKSLTETHPEVADAWVLSAEILLGQGQSGRAVDTILRGLAQRPNSRGLLLLKARAEAIRSPMLAVPTLRLLSEQDPNDLDMAIRLAEAYSRSDEPDKAVELLKKQLSVCAPAERTRCQVALAIALHESGKKADAQTLLDTLIQSNPDDSAPLVALTGLLTADKLWTQVQQKLADWSGKHPTDTRTPIVVAGGLAAARDSQALQMAVGILTAVLQRNPNSVATMNVLAMILQTAGRTAESAQIYQRILQTDPNHVMAMNNLAWALCEEQNRCREALDLTERGLKIAPQYLDLIDTRGVIYYRLGQYDKAVQDFTECLRLYPDNVAAAVSSRFHLARAFVQLNRKADAKQHLQQALDMQPRIGGLSEADLAEARSLMEKLKQGN